METRLDVTETTLLIQDTDTALQVSSPPSNMSITSVPLESADILPEIAGCEPHLPNSVETNDQYKLHEHTFFEQ